MKPFPPQPADGHGPTKVMKKFTPETAGRIVNYIAAGCFVETAAAAAGISKVTFYDWLKRGRKRGHGALFEFAEKVEQAMAASEVNAVIKISNAAATNWQAAAWHLERKFPERWGRREHVELSGNPLRLDVEFMPVLRRLAGQEPVPPAIDADTIDTVVVGPEK